MGFFSLLMSLFLAFILSWRGYRKGSLTYLGACAAFFVGFLTMISDFRSGILLLAFYGSSTKLTKYKKKIKKSIDETYALQKQRGAHQVLACSFLGTCLALGYAWTYNNMDHMDFNVNFSNSFLFCCILGHYACCNGDTWASELGVLSKTEPFLLTLPIRRVPRGCNGGISLFGTVASAMGGIFIGLISWLYHWFFLHQETQIPQYHLITLGLFAGIYGSFVDSILGTYLQATWYNHEQKMITSKPSTFNKTSHGCITNIGGYDLLSNEQVNVLSVIIATFSTGILGIYLFI